MQLIKNLFVGITFAGAMSVAHATPITWVDAIDFTPDRYIAPHASSSYTHDLRDDGFSPLSDLVLGYSLSVDLYDDGDKALEVALIDTPGLAGDKIFFDLAGQELGGWSLAGFAQLEDSLACTTSRSPPWVAISSWVAQRSRCEETVHVPYRNPARWLWWGWR